ncbi:hypothetical protein Q8F55_006531 [Vanrija albida]|uniref:Myb-like domain-containing protein n=1 Tax=Vanrija albida TaxID=181172 RepID=A0ABR3PXP6_9TREE
MPPPRRRASTSVPLASVPAPPTPPSRPRVRFRAGASGREEQASSPEPGKGTPPQSRFAYPSEESKPWTPDALERLYRAVLRRERWDVVAEHVGHGARECAAKWKELDARLVLAVRAAADAPAPERAVQSDTDRLGDDEWDGDELGTDFDGGEDGDEDGETDEEGGGGGTPGRGAPRA